MMKFVREINVKNINDIVINDLEQYGFTLIWKDASIEVYADVLDTNLENIKAS